MSEKQRRRGQITKIVRVPCEATPKSNSLPAEFVGYGILRPEMGQDVFFAGADVANGRFESLDIGDEVSFLMEPGPLSRAARVWAPAADRHRPSIPSRASQ